MKKNLLGVAILAIVVIAILNVNINSKGNVLSFSLRNVEGLASELVCTASSGNIGVCKKNIGSGYSCVYSFDTLNCIAIIYV
jgi:hypothetical protein